MAKYTLDMEEYSSAARKMVAEGQVLIKNDKGVLPLAKGSTVSVFGRTQLNYYKSGTGSGGMVNVSKVTGIMEALREAENISVNEKLASIYTEWEKENPFDKGTGWGTQPWCQKEMPLTDDMVKTASEESDTAIVIIGRSAGEDQDNSDTKGSYRLSDEEEQMLEIVRKYYDRMVVVLNVGNIIDMSFMDTYSPEAVLYAWQGGMIGGYGTVDVLTGAVCPSGHLPDTIAYSIHDYASDKNFGNDDRDLYQEDIYVGYRYFQTFAPDKVRYPFGYGLSYTDFDIQIDSGRAVDGHFTVKAAVKNTGAYTGKAVVQLYVQAPQGELGQPVRKLAAFYKTEDIAPGAAEEITLDVAMSSLASYDDSGVTGNRFCYVLEQGEYVFYLGENVRDTIKCGAYVQDTTKVTQRLNQAVAPVTHFTRIKPSATVNNVYTASMEEVPVRSSEFRVLRENNYPVNLDVTGDMGYKLSDVEAGNVTMEQLVAQFSDDDLSCIIRGEGMGSPKVTPGTAAAFGGVSESLKAYGLPCACCSDGPSGMRLDCGMKAFSLPNGTLIASSFNEELAEELYHFTGIEMTNDRVDVLLGPGMNIHRHPLNGRNFEYFSEDPLLTGKMAAAELRGLHQGGTTGCIKHFCANNQEHNRHMIDSVISERALREIYLKGYEYAVKEGNGDAVMTTYGAVNGQWTAGMYELNTVILRGEWGFDGVVMTDWWAKISREGKEPDHVDFAQMAAAQNDLYMVCQDGAVNSIGDTTLAELESGWLHRGELQRNAMNICRFLIRTHAYERMNGEAPEVEVIGGEEEETIDYTNIKYYKVEGTTEIDMSHINTERGSSYVYALNLDKPGIYEFSITARSNSGELAQMPVTFINQGFPVRMFTFNGTGGEWVTMRTEAVFFDKYPTQRLYFGESGLDVKSVKLTYLKPVPMR